MRPTPPTPIVLFLLVFPGLLWLGGCAEDPAPRPLPGAALLREAEARLAERSEELQQSPGHAALVGEVRQDDLADFMARIVPMRDGAEIVMVSLGGIERHGGGVLALIATLWRPEGRPAALSDAFPFAATGRAWPLREIYESLRWQLYLPVPGVEPDRIAGRLPDAPQLARVRVRHRLRGPPREEDLDGYAALGLLVRFQEDLDAEWTNRTGQVLSARRLLDDAWRHYQVPLGAEVEARDHGYLHLVEILLAYDRRRPPDLRDPDALKRRLLDVELARSEFGAVPASEALGHYADSLGRLISDDRIHWSPEDAEIVRGWLTSLESTHRSAFEDAPVEHLSHLVRGLRRIEANAARLP